MSLVISAQLVRTCAHLERALRILSAQFARILLVLCARFARAPRALYARFVCALLLVHFARAFRGLATFAHLARTLRALSACLRALPCTFFAFCARLART